MIRSLRGNFLHCNHSIFLRNRTPDWHALSLGAAKMKWDPAVVASPALTTIVDITGLLIHFVTAKMLLGI